MSRRFPLFLLKKLYHLFEDKIGLNPTSLSEIAWEQILMERMSVIGIRDPQQYFQAAIASPLEIQELIELIVVPESWFFRDRASIEFIKDKILLDWSARKISTSILSIPCSSGEEPFSIAMTLLEAGLPPASFKITGMDISKKLIARAELGLFRKNSFRSKDLGFRDRYFEETTEGYQIRPFLQKLVHFEPNNFFDSEFILRKGRYDVIFCRNLFIYLNLKAQKKAFDILTQLLAPKGILIVSPVEAEIARRMGFVPLGPLKTAMFSMEKKGKAVFIRRAIPEPPLSKPVIQAVNAEKVSSEDNLLERARELADKGAFKDAAELCREFLKTDETNADAYFLLALIHHASENETLAEEFFTKAIYLNPNHYEALVYLALLLEKKGDSKNALLYRKRAERLVETSQQQ